jgi:hypothetical protein
MYGIYTYDLENSFPLFYINITTGAVHAKHKTIFTKFIDENIQQHPNNSEHLYDIWLDTYNK